MRKFIFLFLVYVLTLFNLYAYAQEGKLNFPLQDFKIRKPIALNSDSKPVFLFAPLKNRNLFSPLVFDITHGGCSPVIESSVHYTAFFCKMETRLRERFNIWVKIRAGGDDEYRKMTEEK
jgi:hypothetical protein